LSSESPRPPIAKHLIGWIGVGLARGFAYLPWFCYRPLAWLLGGLFSVTLRRRRHIARTNIALCFPELSASAQKKRVRENFNSLAFSLFEFARAWWGRIRAEDVGTEIKGLAYLQAAVAEGKGVILVSCHLMTLEYCLKILSQQVLFAGLYRPYDSAVLEWCVRQARRSYTADMFARDELRPVLRHLKSGGVLWYAPDQETRRGESVFVPFFGQAASTLTSSHQLAKLSGARVLSFFHQRLDNGRYQLEISAPLEDFPSTDAHADTTRIMALFESMIRRCPEQYLWQHARFKRQPDGQNPY
jgi:Kdo2-lipid IVA lauroyltransferase/acyltransferase